MITFAYITARREPKFEWFVDSFLNQIKETEIETEQFRVVVVDFYKNYSLDRSKILNRLMDFTLVHTPPKPTVWQGANRLTSQDYFAAANARNTALCLAPDGWIVYIDDLSVLMPGWLKAVLEATKRDGIITLGAYRKVNEIVVENGIVKSFTNNPIGNDVRLSLNAPNCKPCRGQWHYGSSLVAPVEAYLEINGWDENCDGMGYEDVVTGAILENAGRGFCYDPNMLTVESNDDHFIDHVMLRIDKGISPHDKSHRVLGSARQSKFCPNYFGAEGIRGLRQKVLNGEPFPIIQIPEHDWFDGQPLREM